MISLDFKCNAAIFYFFILISLHIIYIVVLSANIFEQYLVENEVLLAVVKQTKFVSLVFKLKDIIKLHIFNCSRVSIRLWYCEYFFRCFS